MHLDVRTLLLRGTTSSNEPTSADYEQTEDSKVMQAHLHN